MKKQENKGEKYRKVKKEKQMRERNVECESKGLREENGV